jgi:hypothetical protein
MRRFSRSSEILAGVALPLLVACSGPVANGSAKPTAGNLPQTLFSEVQSSIASGQALDATKPCHLDQTIQSPEQLKSQFIADFLQMKVPPFFTFTFSPKDTVVEAIYNQPQPAVSVRIRATLKDFQCDSFSIDDPSIGRSPASDLIARAHNPSLERP